jgi:FAD/FMN-containing dehydrogenase
MSQHTATSSALDGLARRLQGQLLRPSHPGYAAETTGYNSITAHRPELVVVALGAADVQAAVGFAAEHALPVTVQATGHGPAGAFEGGLLINTRHMRSVSVDPIARVARAEAGAQWHQVIAAAAHHGLAPVNGSSPIAGVVGYTLGGGLGLLSRKYGYAADRVSRVEVVTADGWLREATPTAQQELFWALRGGKGNFGVVTAIEFGLVPVARLYGGGLFFDGEFASRVLHAWRRWTTTVPEEMGSSLALLRLPPMPDVPPMLRDRLAVHLRIAYAGDPAEGERLTAPLRATAPTLMDTLADMPYTDVGAIHMDPELPNPYHQDALMLRELNDDAANCLLAMAGPGADCQAYLVEIRHLGGALARPPVPGNAVGHRDAAFVLATVSPPDAPLGEPVVARMAPWGTGHKYVNFLAGPRTAGDVAACYEPATLERLAAVKAAYDPRDMFRPGHHIPPAPTPGSSTSSPTSDEGLTS